MNIVSLSRSIFPESYWDSTKIRTLYPSYNFLPSSAEWEIDGIDGKYKGSIIYQILRDTTQTTQAVGLVAYLNLHRE